VKGLDLTVLILSGAIGSLVGGVIAWIVSAALSRREVDRVESSWKGRFEASRLDTVGARAEVRTLAAANTELAAKHVGALSGVAALRQQVEDQGRLLLETRRSREELTHQCGLLTAEIEALKVRWVEADGPSERDRQLRVVTDRLAATTTRLDEAVKARNVSDAERTRLALQVVTITRQLQQSSELARADRARHDTARALQATVVTDLKRQVEEAHRLAAEAQAERVELDSLLAAWRARAGELETGVRSGTVELQERLAAATAELGAFRAVAERVEPLRRQLEDREALIRSLAKERDDATLGLIQRERELLARIEALVQQVAGAARAEQALKDRDRELAKATRRLVGVERDRDELAIALQRAEVEVANLRGEIKDRDARFRVLLADRRAFVEASHGEVARLTSLANRPRAGTNGVHEGDDLKRISGIGPTLEKLLKSRGIHSFRQIALWTEEDIDRIADELGAFRSRINKDQWIEQARREHEQAYGEPVGS
jgi:predicted flap endonuclease-1-like 5' DNA nuclease